MSVMPNNRGTYPYVIANYILDKLVVVRMIIVVNEDWSNVKVVR